LHTADKKINDSTTKQQRNIILKHTEKIEAKQKRKKTRKKARFLNE
jgi:hypothetical protein